MSITSTPCTRCRPCAARAGCGSTRRDSFTSWLPGTTATGTWRPASRSPTVAHSSGDAVVGEVTLHDEQLRAPRERVTYGAARAANGMGDGRRGLLHPVEETEVVAADVEVVDRRDAARLRARRRRDGRDGDSVSSASTRHASASLAGCSPSTSCVPGLPSLSALPRELRRRRARRRRPTDRRAGVSLQRGGESGSLALAERDVDPKPLEMLRERLRLPAARGARRRTRARPARRPGR